MRINCPGPTSPTTLPPSCQLLCGALTPHLEEGPSLHCHFLATLGSSGSYPSFSAFSGCNNTPSCLQILHVSYVKKRTIILNSSPSNQFWKPGHFTQCPCLFSQSPYTVCSNWLLSGHPVQWEASSFAVHRPFAGWTRPTHMREESLLLFY